MCRLFHIRMYIICKNKVAECVINLPILVTALPRDMPLIPPTQVRVIYVCTYVCTTFTLTW